MLVIDADSNGDPSKLTNSGPLGNSNVDSRSTVGFRHSKKANVLYQDMHVESMAFHEVPGSSWNNYWWGYNVKY